TISRLFPYTTLFRSKVHNLFVLCSRLQCTWFVIYYSQKERNGVNEMEILEMIEAMGTNYMIARTKNGLAYIWTWRSEIEEDDLAAMIETPTAEHGAMVGTKEELIWEVENCVGSYRWCGDEEQAEAAEEVVGVLLEAIQEA